MAPPPPAMLNGNLSNGIANNKPSNIITPPNHAGLLKEIETGNKSQILLLLFFCIQQANLANEKNVI